MKPGGLCSPSDGSNMPSGDAVGAVPAHRPPDNCNQFPKASTTSRESHVCLTPDLYEHNHVLRPTNSHFNGLLSCAGLSNGVYESPYTSNKGFNVPRHILSPPQSEDGEDEGPASCTTSRGTVTRACSNALLCLHASNTAAASTSSHLASPTFSLPNVCGKGLEQLTVVTSAQEEKPAASTDCKTSGDASCFPFVGSSVFSPKAARSGSGSGTFSTSGETLASSRSSKRPRGRRKISLEEMVAKLHNRTEANWSGTNVLQNFSTPSTVNHRVVQEKSVDCMRKDFCSLSTESNSVMKSSYQSGQSLPNICDNNNTATIYDAHLSKNSSIKDINSKSDSGDICCGEGSSSGLLDRTESTVANLLKELDKSQTALSENVPVMFPNVSNLKENSTDSADNIPGSHITKCSSLENGDANIISSLTGNLQIKHKETRLINPDHDIVRTEGSVGSLGTSAETSNDDQTENVLNQHSSQGQCLSEDLQSKSALDLQNVQCDLVSKLKHFEEMCLEIPVQTAAKVTSDDSVIDLTVEPEIVRCNSVELLESASVESRDYESDIEVLFQKGVSSEKSSGCTEREPRTSSSSNTMKEFVRPIGNRSDDGEGDHVCSDKGTLISSDSVQEMYLSKVDDEASVPASLVNTDCESVQYLEPISDDENSLLCAPSLSSGLSSVSGFQSNSDTPMFSDTPSDASRGRLMVRISDAVAAILSDVSDGSLPTSPLASSSNSVDGFQTLVPKEKLSEKIDSICDQLQRECMKDSSLHLLELGNRNRLQSDVHSENFKEVSHTDFDKERTAFQVGISEKSQPSKRVSGDIVLPEVECAQIQKQTDLGLNFQALSSLTQPLKDVSFESLLPAKTIYELPSSVIPDEPASKRQGSETQPQVAHPSEPDQHINKLAVSVSHKEFSSSLSLVPGLLCAVTTTSQSSSNSTLSPDTHVTFSSHTQVPIEGLGTVVCSSTLNTGNNLCQNHISGSQTISSQTQNCNTSQIESKENAAGLLKIPSAITLDTPSRSEQSPEPVTDNVLHRRSTSHLETHPHDDSTGGDNSLPKLAVKFSCTETLSHNESCCLSLMPNMDSVKDACVPRNSNAVHMHEETIMKQCAEVNKAVEKLSDNVNILLQAESSKSHLATENSDFTAVKDHTLLGSATEGISFQSFENLDAKKMPVSLETLVERTNEDICSVKETGFVAAGSPEESSLEHIQPSSGHTTTHSPVSVDYTVKDNLPVEDQSKNDPELEASSQKKTHSPESDANLLTSQKIGTKDLLTNELTNKESGFAFGISDEHGQRGRSLVAFKEISNEFTDENHSLLMLSKVNTSLLEDILNEKNKSSEEVDSGGESLLQVKTTKDDGSFSDLIEKSKLSGDATDQICSSTELKLKDGTSSSEIHATLSDYCTESITDTVSSKVPIYDEKSSLPESSTTENSAVAAYPFSTVVLLTKHDSVDQTSYQSPSEVEWSTNMLHSQIFTTSDSLSPCEESTSSDVPASLKNASEFSRPKNICPPLGGAASDITHPSLNVSQLDSDLMIQDTLKEEISHTVDETDLSLTGVDKVAPKDIRPPLGTVEDKYQPAEVILETSHQLSDVIAPEHNALYAGTAKDMLFHIQDVTEVSHQPNTSSEICHITTTDTKLSHYPAEDTEISHHPDASPEFCPETTTDTEVSHQQAAVTEVSHQPDASTEVCHIMTTNTEVSHQPSEMTEVSCLPDSSAIGCHLATITPMGKQSTVPFDTHIHPPAEVTEVLQPLISPADVIKPLTYITEDSHLPAKVTEVSHIQPVAAEIRYSLATAAAEVSHPPAEVFCISPSLADANEVSHSPVTAAEVSYPPAEVFHITPPLADADKVNHSSATDTEVNDLPSYATEISCLQATSTEENQVTAIDNSHFPAATREVGFPRAVCAEVSYSQVNVSEVKPSHSAITEVFQQRCSIEDSSIQTAMTELTFPHTTTDSEVGKPPAEATEVSHQQTVAAEVSSMPAGAPEISYMTAAATETSQQPVDVSEFAHPRGAAEVTSQQIEFSTQLSVACTEVNHTPADITEINNSSADVSKVTHPPIIATEVSCFPTTQVNFSHAEATEVTHLPAVTTEVSYLPSANSDANILPAAALEGSQLLAVTNEIWHLPAPAAEVSHLPAKASETSHLSAAAIEVSHPPNAVSEFSHLSTDTTEVNHPPATVTEVSQPSTDTNKVSHPPTIAAEVSQRQTPLTEVIDPLADITCEVGHLPNVIPESSLPYTNHPPEIVHSPSGVVPEGSHPHFDITANVRQSLAGTTMPVSCLVPDVRPEISHLIDDVSGEVSVPQFQVTTKDWEEPVQSTKDTDALLWITGRGLQPHEVRQGSCLPVEGANEISHPPDQSTPAVNHVQAECTKPNHMQVESNLEVIHAVDESACDVSHPPGDCAVEVNFSSLEATNEVQYPAVEAITEVSHPSAEYPTDVNHSSPGYTPEVTNPFANSCTGIIHPPTDVTTEINHSPLEATTATSQAPIKAVTEDNHPSDDPIHEVSHPAVEACTEVSHSPVETSVEVSHPSAEPTTDISHDLAKDGPEANFLVESKTKISHPPKVKGDVGHLLTKVDVINNSVVAASETCYPPVESNNEGSQLTFNINTEVSHPSGPIAEVSHHPVNEVSHFKAVSEVSQPPIVSIPKMSHSPDVDTIEGSHLPVEATVGVSHLPIEAITEERYPPVEDSTEFIHHLVESTTNISNPPSEGTTDVSHQSIEPTFEVSHPPVRVTTEVSHPVVEPKSEATADFTQPHIEATTEVCHPPLLTTGNVTATGNVTTDNPVCLTENTIRDLAVLEDGITKYSDTDNKKVPQRLQASDSHTNDNPDQDTSSLNETFDVSDDDEDLMVELALVKEEVHQTVEDSLSHTEVEDTSIGVMTTVAGALPTISNIGAGVQADAMDHILSINDVDNKAEQIHNEVLDNRNIKGNGENMELEVLGTPCPICFEQLNVPLENHLIEQHICNTFVPAKTSREYQYHMLRRVKDVEIPEPEDACFRNNVYVCRSCQFSSSDINAVRFHLNTHEDVYQVKMGDVSCKCNKKEYSYPFHKWKTLIHNSSYHCYKCNFYFACEKGFYNHLLAMHYVHNFCKICKAEVPKDSMISHANFHKDKEETSSTKENILSQNTCMVTRSSGGNFGISWNIYDNCLNFLDGKDFRLSTCSKVFDADLDRSYLKLPLKNVVEEALVPDEAKIDPGKDITKYMKGKKTIRLSLGDDNDEVLRNLSLSVQIELQKKVSRKGRRGHGSTPRAKREDDLFDVLGISSSRSRGAPKKEALDLPGKQVQVRMVKGKLDEESKVETEHLELPHLTRTRSGMQPGKSSQEKNEKPLLLETSFVIEGEWSKEHTYICCSCGAGYLNLADIMDHKWEMHPSVWCAHTMIQGQGVVPLSFCRQYQAPTGQPQKMLLPSTPTQEMQTGLSRRNSDADISEVGRKDQKTCTRCSAQFEDVDVFHAHLVECGGLSLFSSMKKKNKKGYRFKRRKGQGVPNNRYGNNSQPSTPLKVKTGDRSSGLNTPQNDRSSTAAIHSSGVKRRLELAVGSIDNLELKNRLKAIITGSRSKGSGAFGLPSRRTVRMKLRKKALETRRLRKTRHSDRVKENVKKDQEKKEDKKVVDKNEKEDKSEVQEFHKGEEAQILTKKSGIKKGSIDIVKESKLAKGSITKQEDPKSKEKSKKKLSKVSTVNVEGNVMVTEVSKPFTVPTSEALDVCGDSKNVKNKSKQEELHQEGSQVGKKLETEKRINGVIGKVKKSKKKNEIADNNTKSFNKSSGLKVKQSSDKKTSSKAVKSTQVTKVTETDFKHDGIKKVAGPIENIESMVKKDSIVPLKQNIGKKIAGTKMKQALSKSIGLLDKSRNNRDKKALKNENKKKFIESEPRHELPSPTVPTKTLVGEKKVKPKKAKEIDIPELDTKVAELEGKQPGLKKSSSFDQCSKIEVDSSENQLTSFPQDAKTNIQEASKEKENEVQESMVSQLPKVRRHIYYSSSSEDSEDSEYSEPEVIRNFRSGRSCGGRMGLRNRRKPINTRYSFRTCFSSAKKDDGSDLEEGDIKPKKVDYQEKEEEEFSEELPVTSKRKRKVANYENQDDYTYVPNESSSDAEDYMSGKEMDAIVERIPWSARKKRKILTRSKNKDISKPLSDTSLQEENWSEEKLEMLVEIPVDASKKNDIPLKDAPGITDEDRIENEVKMPKSKKNKKLVNTYSDNPEMSYDEGKWVNEVKMPKTKKNTKLINSSSDKPEEKEEKIENEVKLPKRKKNTKLLNTFSDILDVRDNEISTKVPKKKKSAVLLERLSSDDIFQEEGKGIVGKFPKTKNVKEIPPQMAIASIQEASEVSVRKPQKKNVKFQNTVTEKLEEETEESLEKTLKKNKCVRLQSNLYDNLLSSEVHPIVRKTQKKKNVKLQKNRIDTQQYSVQEMDLMVATKKNVRGIDSMPSTGECAQHETEEIVEKVEKEKKLVKSKVKSNNIFHHTQGEHFGSLPEYSLIGLPSTAKRKKKVLKKNNLEQDTSHIEALSTYNLAEEEEDNIPLSTLAYLNIKMKKEKQILNTLKSKKGAVKECLPPKHKKAIEKLKKTLPVKNRDLFIKETVAFDSESSSFEGFAPVPFKKADRGKTAIKKTKKRLGRVKSVIDINASSTASESESSDIPKTLRKPKKLPVFSYDEMGTEDISMPNLSKFSKIKRDQENYPFHHQPSVKIQASQKRVRAKPKLKPALQENLDSAEGKTKVLKSSKKRNSSFIPHTMPVLEPMNIFKPDMERASDHPESDSNGEGVPTLTQKLPAKAKRRRSSIEKIKDIPTRSSMQQMIESQSPPDLKAVIDEPRREDTDISPLLTEHQMPLLKTKSMKPPQQRKRRTKSSQELLLKSKPDIALGPPPETNAVSEVINQIKGPGTSMSQKRPAKRKRAASTSGVPSKYVEELVSSLKGEVDQPLAHLSVASRKNSENVKRKKTGNSSKQDVNELKCIDCGLRFGSIASLEDHQQDCVTIAFEMSLMEAEDHLFECPHCHLTFALKGTQRKHTTSCRMVKYKRTANRNENKTLKRASRNVVPLDTQLPEVVASNDLTAIVGTPCRALVKGRRRSKENVADDHVACASPLRDSSMPSFTNHSSKVDGSEGKLLENTKKVDHMQRVVVPLAAIGSSKTKKASQVNGKLVNGDILDLFSPVNVDDNQKCSVCGFEVTDQDLSHKHQLLKQFTHCCQQQAVLEVCALVTYYNLSIDAVRSLISSAIVYQGSTILSLDAKQQMSFNASFISANVSSNSATKLQELLASPHCVWISSGLETIAKHHQTAEAVSISGTRQEALKAVSALEEILKEISEVDSAIRKNLMLKSMREKFEAGTLN